MGANRDRPARAAGVWVRITFVSPRYGGIGGAEAAVRALATRLAARGHQVRVLTSNATEMTWEPSSQAGTTNVEGVVVTRLQAARPRLPELEARYSSFLRSKGRCGDGEAFLRDQGPVLEGLEEELDPKSWDRIAAYPYMYWPQVKAMRLAGRRGVLHPAAHPEPLLDLAIYKQVFAAAPRIVLQTEAERALVNTKFPVGGAKLLTLPLGVDDAFSPRTEVPTGEPYCLYLGRIQRDKGALFTYSLFNSVSTLPKLVMAGPVVEPLQSSGRVEVAGPVSEAKRLELLRGATAVVIGSRYEAFSLVAAEALASGVPIVVNGRNPVLAEQARLSGGGFAPTTPAGFAAAVAMLARNPDLVAKLGAAGARYASEVFSWQRIITRYERFLTDGGC